MAKSKMNCSIARPIAAALLSKESEIYIHRPTTGLGQPKTKVSSSKKTFHQLRTLFDNSTTPAVSQSGENTSDHGGLEKQAA